MRSDSGLYDVFWFSLMGLAVLWAVYDYDSIQTRNATPMSDATFIAAIEKESHADEQILQCIIMKTKQRESRNPSPVQFHQDIAHCKAALAKSRLEKLLPERGSNEGQPNFTL